MAEMIVTNRVLNLPIRKLKRKNTIIPEAASFCDVLKANFKTNSNFEIITFKDKKKNIIGKKITIKDDAGNVKVIDEIIENYKEYSSRLLKRFIYLNNKLKKELFKVIYAKNECFDETSVEIADGIEQHSISLLQKGKKPARIKYIPNWEGKEEELIYENTGGKVLHSKYKQYFPIWVCDGFAECFEKMVRHINKIQEKKHNMPQGVIPEPRVLKHRKMNTSRHTKDETLGFCDPFTGQIYLSDKNSDNSFGLLGTLAHEYRHAVDISDCMRLKSNAEQVNSYTEEDKKNIEKELPGHLKFCIESIKRGIIDDNSSEGIMLNRLTEDLEKEVYGPKMSKKVHDELEIERRAIEEDEKESKKVDTLIQETLSFLHNFVK